MGFTGFPEEALEFYVQAKSLAERYVGPKSVSASMVIGLMARLRFERGDVAGAEIEVLVNNRKIDNGSAATWQTGSNTVKVNVTAANGTAKKTYTVTVTKS